MKLKLLNLLQLKEDKMSPRGGTREGAGRKIGYRKPEEERKPRRPTLAIVGTESELNRLRKKAEKAGKSISRFVLESLNCLDEQNKD